MKSLLTISLVLGLAFSAFAKKPAPPQMKAGAGTGDCYTPDQVPPRSIGVCWDASTTPANELSGYRLYYSTTSHPADKLTEYESSTQVDVASVKSMVAGLTGGQTYYVRLIAIGTDGTPSDPTEEASGATKNPKPNAPSNLRIIEGMPSAALTNISTRGFIGTGDSVMIAGLTVKGDADGVVKCLLRAIGPSLSNYGVANPIPNPTIRLFNSQGEMIAQNDDWTKDSNAVLELGANGLIPGSPLESALYANLHPGAYTAIVSGVDNSTGVGLVEAYAIP